MSDDGTELEKTKRLVQYLGIGRIVHYVLAEGVIRPAIVVSVLTDATAIFVDLHVFTKWTDPPLVAPPEAIPYDEAGAVGTWQWPPRV